MFFQLREWNLTPAKFKQCKNGLLLVVSQQQCSHIAAPLHALTQKIVTFTWTKDCQHAFTTLKHNLLQLTILRYPQFHSTAKQFVVYTDTSDFRLGAVLEQNNCVIAYASRILIKLEQNYSVIQTECLAIVHICQQAIQALFTWSPVSNPNTPCTITVANSTANERTIV